jgi:deoxycytidylate deaminase
VAKSDLPPCPYTVNERWAFLDMAAEEAEMSKCDRSKVGAALVEPGGKFVHIACNQVPPGHGSRTCRYFCPRGAKSYDELPSGSEPMDDCNSLHAEFAVVNLAMDRARQFGPDELPAEALRTDKEALREFFDGHWLFSTKEPCEACKMYIQGLGIRYQFATSWQRRVVREGKVNYLGVVINFDSKRQ